MRIGLDLGDAPAYFDLMSFLPPCEYGALLEPRASARMKARSR